MNFIQQAYNGKNEFWRYLIGSLIIFGATLVGQMPFTVAVFAKAIKDGTNIYELDETKMLSYLEPNLNIALLLLSFVFALLGLWIAVKFLHKQTLKIIITTRNKIDWKRFGFAFIFWGIISVVMIYADYTSNPENYEWNFELNRFLILCIIAIILVPIQTSVEELVFRGYLMQGFGFLAKNRWFPLVMTSVIFGGMHIFNPEVGKLGYSIMIYYIGTGLFLGILTLMDEGMELPLGFHAANNLFTALLVTANWTAFQTHSVLKEVSEPSLEFIDLVLPVFIIYPILLLIFAKVYKWTNWKEKLFGKIEMPIEPSTEIDQIKG
ncbi:lysostaphin resistance A-like protein [Aurantibacter sp.]|uniref:CPBP family intramembrane glutamic endopeptidase n=1 Tax=Aurantibacter sp. TaxID=2807103 RepID=UPI0035C862D1